MDYVCENCDRTFKKKFGLTNHLKSCKAQPKQLNTDQHIVSNTIKMVDTKLNADQPFNISLDHTVLVLQTNFANQLGKFLLQESKTQQFIDLAKQLIDLR